MPVATVLQCNYFFYLVNPPFGDAGNTD